MGDSTTRKVVAAAYARFSSDAQRDESIEIQLREIARLVEREGWEMGESYCDHAISGRTDERPAFRRCIADGEAGAYDVLVIYKLDRLARNVSVAQQAKRRLFDAGRRLVSVREGEITDTPDGFLMSSIGDIFAEYYSRNLAVLVRGGIDQAARDLRACGVRIYGYGVDESDHFYVDEATAPFVRGMFSRYLAGESMTQIAAWLNESGARSQRGNRWTTQALSQVMRNRAYKGVYSFAGREVPGGIPAIVSEEDFDRVQAMRARRHRAKRRFVTNDYLLSGKTWCGECGGPMCGTAGTSCTGRKYTYYGCVLRGGCGTRVSSNAVEDAVVSSVSALLADGSTREEIVSDMLSYASALPDHTGEFLAERREVERRRDNLVRSIAEGVPPRAVAEAVSEAEARLDELDALVAHERAARERLPDEARVRAFLDSFLGDGSDPEWRRLVVRTFVDRIFVTKRRIAVTFNMGLDAEEVPFEEIRGLLDAEKTRTSSGLVRVNKSWWTYVCMSRTETDPVELYRRRTDALYAIIIEAA